MASEAEIKAEREAYAEDKAGLPVMVVGWPLGQGTSRETLTEDGGLDLYKHARSRGIRPSRSPPARPVDEGIFRRLMTGASVTCEGNYFFDRELSREGAEAVWDDDQDKKWHWGWIEP